jgi:hypothetical protein
MTSAGSLLIFNRVRAKMGAQLWIAQPQTSPNPRVAVKEIPPVFGDVFVESKLSPSALCAEPLRDRATTSEAA